MLKGFRDFLMRGNVVDLAVAVVIGVAFSGVVDAFIEAVVDPLIVSLAPQQKLDQAFVVGPFKIGLLLSAVLAFVTKAAVVYFFIVRPFRNMAARLAPAPAPAAPPADVQLLTEIRDLLKDRQ